MFFANWQTRPSSVNDTVLAPIVEADFSYAAGRLHTYMAPVVTAFYMVRWLFL